MDQIISPASIRVLVVDDIEDSANSLAGLLTIMGYEAQAAFSGLAALAAAKSFRPDVILLDLAMPLMDGITVAKRLREDPETAHIILIALTAFSDEKYRQQTQQAGFASHFVKPVQLPQLRQALGQVLASKQS
jgi:CheY-like chemotaxis protein